ncbi:hypothetical protein G5B00_00105 [Parapedobacter sp. SGR-10]|uniref:hypothetical protein n=1 Tax=Parapedobacter sp. SGR-10 TaxID=2710879 RepID=UPI0013D43042|nr:hypothetical protein [Parapedobacter sp. SGR-10]NGF54899.1 hypothetical protein [Parapedobacter sp. SGR-10]
MGIRYEKDTILNWINEMGKFLRLVVGKWEGNVEELSESVDVESGYTEFFRQDRTRFLEWDNLQLEEFVSTLESEQVRPLAQLLMYDGLLSENRNLLEKARFLFELNMRNSGSFAFEDYGFLAKIDNKLKS